ncbi:MAG: hydrogenase iron-sulfur subunit [Thermodesulfobacteriota bacterium]
MKPTFCVLGTGRAAEQTAARLTSENIEVIRIVPVTDTPMPPPPTSGGSTDAIVANLVQVEAEAGRFLLSCRFKGATAVYESHAVVIAEPADRRPPWSAYGLMPGEGVISLSEALEHLDRLPDGKTVVFLLGLAGESHPVVTREVLEAAKAHAVRGRAYLLTGNLKVADQGLEALVQECRTAGVIPVKFTQTRPIFRQTDEGMLVDMTDEQIGESFSILADRIVVDERFQPAGTLPALASVFRIETDAEGFLQADNVHRFPVFTNRKGVFVVGPSRGAFQWDQLEADIAHVALEARRMLQEPLPAAGVPAAIQPGRCVRCLTCYRVCPYGAIRLKARPEVLSDSCQRCGICVAECPGKAISLADVLDEVLFERIDSFRRMTDSHPSPLIVVFGCERSAKLCRDAAREQGLPLPERLCFIEVPCAGRLSLDWILGTFNRSADGVLVLTCHAGNCHSGQGNLHARRRITYLREMLSIIGMNPDRLRIKTLAANMPVEFASACREFEATIHSLLLS